MKKNENENVSVANVAVAIYKSEMKFGCVSMSEYLIASSGLGVFIRIDGVIIALGCLPPLVVCIETWTLFIDL